MFNIIPRDGSVDKISIGLFLSNFVSAKSEDKSLDVFQNIFK